MRTDHALGELFSCDPDLIKLLVRLPENGHYHMKSDVIKAVDRQVDACFMPEEAGLPLIVCEFQGYNDDHIYYRLLSGAGLAGERNSQYTVHALLVFIDDKHDPMTEPWHSLGRSGFPGFQVVYLREIYDHLRKQEPHHPVVALFGLLIESKEKLKSASRKGYLSIQNAALSERLRDTYAKIYAYWLMQRLNELSRKEVDEMLGILTPLKETRAYKDIRDEVRNEVREEYYVQELSRLSELCKKGSLTEQGYREVAGSIEQELAQIRARRNPPKQP